MARRGRSASPSGRSSFGPPRAPARAAPARQAPPPARAAPPPQAPLPARAPPAAVGAPAPVSQGPGLMAQMAATAGGVAIGSAVGHTIGHALTGGGGGSSNQPQEQQQQPQQYQQQYQQPPPEQQQACAFELKQFLDCSQSYDLSLCEGFNEALKQCRLQNPGAGVGSAPRSNW
ncbi:PREDICTED: coiled-coil-helix-coiled-coil-helix domain-containing protein 2-like [Rhagoletis zephyria]|uniref:coiled-coil-helix-coiled-coil-helix domain-containing protein 2-like n=1 Tax=Rhagoletis zephyria TaxID=28612 RepID=UPI0008118E65|nr:PREDICTED: coiled-coil-helix-coiled-coil-helix domain-containing protein 2-like [Rhagoletis zephyria]